MKKKMILSSVIALLIFNFLDVPNIVALNLEKSTDTKEESLIKIENTEITYSANSTEFYQGDAYRGDLIISNSDEDVLEVGSVFSISVSNEVINYDSLDFSDEVLIDFFDIFLDKRNSKIEFTLKKEIQKSQKVHVKFSATIIGPINSEHNLGVTLTNSIGESKSVQNNNPIVKIIEKPNHSYGFINSFWGFGPDDAGSFLGKSTENINDKPTGVFSRTTNKFQNFIQVNADRSETIPDFVHHRVAWVIIGTPVDIDIGGVVVTDETTGEIIEKKYYSTWLEENKIWIDILSNERSGGAVFGGNHTYRVSLEASVKDDSEVYLTQSYDYLRTETGQWQDSPAAFELNNIFTEDGESIIFPNLKVEDKTFYIEYLNEENMEAELRKNVVATDTNDGDITSKITIDYAHLLKNVNTVGDYEITYFVENSQGYKTKKSANIHIVPKEVAASVTVIYVDEDNNEILDSREELQGFIGDSYKSKSKEFDGYTLIEDPVNAEGTFSNEPQVVTYKYKGLLVFRSAPKFINFGNHSLSIKDKNYSLENKDQDLVVQDYRKKGSEWLMTVQMISDFKGNDKGKKLNSNLFYLNKENGKNLISTENATIIYTKKTENNEAVNISGPWNQEKTGFQLNVPSGSALADNYSATFEWNLQDAVSNE